VCNNAGLRCTEETMLAAMTQIDSEAEMDSVLAASGGVDFLSAQPGGCELR
jgi:hypothetical protein